MKTIIKIILKINKINNKTTIQQFKNICNFINKQKISKQLKAYTVGLCFKMLNWRA